MKKTKEQKRSVIGLILLLGLCIGELNAQMAGSSYSIINNRTCDIAVHYQVSSCPGDICNSTYQIVAANGGVFAIPAGCASAGNDIFVWLKEIDYVDVTGGNNNGSVNVGPCYWSGGGTAVSGTNAPSSCPPSNWSMSANPVSVIIN